MRSHELSRWDAVDLAHAIRTRKISSREAVESTLARVAAVNPRINAIVDPMADEALVAATRADAAVKNGERLGPLHGVPVTVKINVDFADRPTTNGVVAFKDMQLISGRFQGELLLAAGDAHRSKILS